MVGAAGVDTVDRTRDAAATAPRFACFDGFRALAVCGVVLAHVTLQTGATVNSSVDLGPFSLDLGALYARLDVTPPLFFLISAFLLYRPFVARRFSGRGRPDTRQFLWRRALRVLPAYWVAMVVIVFVARTEAVGGFWQGVQYFTLTHIYTPDTVFGPLLQSYTLATEISFYLFLPVYGWVMGSVLRRRDPAAQLRLELGGAVALYLASWAFRWAILAFDVPNNGMMNQWLPARLDIFAIGIALAVVSAWHSHRGAASVPDWLRHPAMPWVAWATAAGAYLVAAYGIGLTRGELRFSMGQQLGRDLLYEIVVLGVVLPGVFGPEDRGLVRGLLRWKPVALIGLVSYGIYLYHEMWLDEYLHWTDTKFMTGSVVPMYLFVLAAATVTATLSYVIVERPVLRFKYRPPWARRGGAPNLRGAAAAD